MRRVYLVQSMTILYVCWNLFIHRYLRSTNQSTCSFQPCTSTQDSCWHMYCRALTKAGGRRQPTRANTVVNDFYRQRFLSSLWVWSYIWVGIHSSIENFDYLRIYPRVHFSFQPCTSSLCVDCVEPEPKKGAVNESEYGVVSDFYGSSDAVIGCH